MPYKLREDMLKHHRKYYQKNKEEIRIKKKEWYRKNKEKVCKQQRKYYIKRSKKLRMEILSLLGNKCSNPKCAVLGGMKDIRALQIDHIHGGGCKKIKKCNNPHYYYETILKQIKAGSKDYQLLCANCNWIKRYEKEECYKGGQ